jgi:hypothetical protein
MIVSIMQPTFIPWAGYFHIIKKSDLFIFLDDVQFNKRSWQQRNKILIQGNEKYLTIPTETKNKFQQKINEVLIDNKQDWQAKHLSTLKHNYSKHPFFLEFYEIIYKIYKKNYSKLIDFNIEIIKSINEYLSISTKIKLSSEFSVADQKEYKILNLLKKSNAQLYLSPIGSKSYLEEGEILKKNNILLEYVDHKCNPYKQKHLKKFISHLSFIDAIFNLGKNAKNII